MRCASWWMAALALAPALAGCTGADDGADGWDETFDIPAGQFAEVNFRMLEGDTVEFGFEVLSGGSVRFDVHSHPGGQVVIHDQGNHPSHDGTFTAPYDGLFSVLWTPEDPARVHGWVRGEMEYESSHIP